MVTTHKEECIVHRLKVVELIEGGYLGENSMCIKYEMGYWTY